MADKFLSEVIDFNRDIAPYRIIQIYSGVGSGKNYWVETLAKQGYNILLITSRKATADAQADKLGGNRWIDLETICQEGIGSKEQKKVVVTNAGIEQFLKKRYDLERKDTHIWNYFDFIILDEAHSLSADATFADSPFYVKEFLDWAENQSSSCKIVYMTGTPAIIDWVFEDKEENPEYNYLNLFYECRHVVPEAVIIYPYDGIETDIAYEINKNNRRIIYFANSITRMEGLVQKLLDIGVQAECIGVSYANAEQTPRNFPPQILDSTKKIEESLVTSEMLPDQIKCFISTSKNQEGINILNDDISMMFCEAQDIDSITQMAGRVRKGLEMVLILYNAPLHKENYDGDEAFLDYVCVEGVNEAFDICYGENKFSQSAIDKFSSIVNKKFDNIRYDYLSKKFKAYEGRIYGFEYILQSRRFLHGCVKNWNSMCNWPNREAFLECFYPAGVGLRTKEEKISDLNKEICDYLKNNNYIGHTITKNDYDIIAKEIRKIAASYGIEEIISSKFKKLGSVLKKFGFKVREAPNQRKGEYYVIEPISDNE